MWRSVQNANPRLRSSFVQQGISGITYVGALTEPAAMKMLHHGVTAERRVILEQHNIDSETKLN
jgi:hypothetical protein